MIRVWSVAGNAEVAHDDNGGGGTNAKVTFTVPSPQDYIVVVHSTSAGSAGTGDLQLDGWTLASNAPFGGATVSVLDGKMQYETALTPTGPTDTTLYGIAGQSGSLVAMDWDGGVGLCSRLSGRTDISTVVVGANFMGLVNLYVNDVQMNDNDRDGLGTRLEDELGTCDSGFETACAGVFNRSDTDRDGLSDSAEVFGVDDLTFPQYLPRWGATPVHKDVFVEVDYPASGDVVPSPPDPNPFTCTHAAFVQSAYAAGRATDLGNVDGVDGIRVHFDLGAFAPPGREALCGDWGGSNEIPSNVGADGYLWNRAAVRAGIFHWARVTPGWGGQSAQNGDHIATGAETMTHELGHNLNLAHWGHDSTGAVNCKPHYASVMNYAYGGNSFSQGVNTQVLDPAKIDEAALGSPALVSTVASLFSFASDGSSVDWNRDGVLTPALLTRAGATYALGQASCGAGQVNLARLVPRSVTCAPSPAPPCGLPGMDSPKLIRYRDRLYLFYIAADHWIYYVEGQVSGADGNGSCPGGSTVGAECMSWTSYRWLPTSHKSTGLSAVVFDSGVQIAYVDESSNVRSLTARDTWPDGTLYTISAETDAGTSSYAPEVAVLNVDPAQFGGKRQALALFTEPSSVYSWRTTTSLGGAWTDQGPVALSSGAAPPVAKAGPAVLPWPAADVPPNGQIGLGTACGAFAEVGGRLRFLCLDPNTNRWDDLTTTAFGGSPPTVVGRPSLAYHVPRLSTGAPLTGDSSRGIFVLTWLQDFGTWWAPRWSFSNLHGVGNLPGAATRFAWAAAPADEWTTVVHSTNATVTVYEDLSLSALKGSWIRREADGSGTLEFLPFLDGTFHADLKDVNDFQIMERGVCTSLHPIDGYCGGPNRFGF